MPQQIIVTISEDADVKVEAKGVTGHGCKALTKAIEDSLGTVKSDQAKPEMFAQGVQQAKALA